jgi:phage shock protein A
MKIMNWILTSLTAASLILAGCSKKTSVDTTPLEKNFASAEATIKTSADKAVSAIKSADYSGALAELKTLASQAKLTPEQQQAVKDVLAQVQQQITALAGKVSEGAQKAAGDLQKSLGK